MVIVVFSTGRGFLHLRKTSIGHSFHLYVYHLTKELVHTSQVYWTTSLSSSLPTTLNFSTNALSVGKYTNKYLFNQTTKGILFLISYLQNPDTTIQPKFGFPPSQTQQFIFMNIYFENTPRKSSQWTMLEAGDNWRSLSRVRESIFHLRYKQDLNMSPEIFRRNGRLFLRVSKEEGILRHLVKSHTIYGLKNFKWNLIRQSSFKDGLDFFCFTQNILCKRQ